VTVEASDYVECIECMDQILYEGPGSLSASQQAKKSSYGKFDPENKSIEEVAVCSSRVCDTSDSVQCLLSAHRLELAFSLCHSTFPRFGDSHLRP
jgi:hypothetical protein